MLQLSSLIAVLGLLTKVAYVNATAGVTTFNDYSTQSSVACSGFSPTNSQGSGIFAAAMADLSPLWTGAKCSGTKDASKCNGKGACTNCTGPSCAGEQQCGHCFTVKCVSSLDGETQGACSGTTIKVKIIDACPSTHPENYCKTPEFGGTVPDNQACEASGTNALDIATTARSSLSTFQGNLNIDIETTTC